MSGAPTTSRLAGLLYGAVVLTGMFSLAYVPARVPLGGDPAAAVAALQASAGLVRLGLAAFLLNQVAFLLLPLALHRDLAPAGKGPAAAMVAFAWVSVPVALAAGMHRLEALDLATSAGLTPEARAAAVAAALTAYRSGLLVTGVFWGLWLAPFGYLAMKARVLPKVIGGLLILGCLGYLVDSFGTLLSQAYDGSLLAKAALLPPALGEIGACLWLLIRGIRREEG